MLLISSLSLHDLCCLAMIFGPQEVDSNALREDMGKAKTKLKSAIDAIGGAETALTAFEQGISAYRDQVHTWASQFSEELEDRKSVV